MSEDVIILLLIILAIPVTIIVYYALAFIFRKLFFRKPVDLSDVVFSKERIEQIEKSLKNAEVVVEEEVDRDAG